MDFEPPKTTEVYGVEAAAKHFGVKARTIQLWVKQGMPKSGKRYDLVACELWRRDRQESAGSGQESGGGQVEGGDKAFWTLREIKARAETRELELRQAQGELVELREVEQLFVARIVAVTQGLESLARALPPLLVNKSEREMEPVISRRVRALRDLFARPLPEKFESADKEEADQAKLGPL